MPTRKQRRRRAKEFRHEYVWEDEEGNELDPGEVPARKKGEPARARPARAGREPQAPSWRRTLKRGAIFAPVMFLVITLLSPDISFVGRLLNTAVIVLVFLPFSYFLDGLFWRSYQRRAGKVDQSTRRS